MFLVGSMMCEGTIKVDIQLDAMTSASLQEALKDNRITGVEAGQILILISRNM